MNSTSRRVNSRIITITIILAAEVFVADMVFPLGLAVWLPYAALVLISCVSTSRVLVTPPHVEGAKFVGSESCADCHETVTKPFKTAVHAHLRAKGTNSVEVGCESCHGAGSVHVDAGGGRGSRRDVEDGHEHREHREVEHRADGARAQAAHGPVPLHALLECLLCGPGTRRPLVFDRVHRREWCGRRGPAATRRKARRRESARDFVCERAEQCPVR